MPIRTTTVPSTLGSEESKPAELETPGSAQPQTSSSAGSAPAASGPIVRVLRPRRAAPAEAARATRAEINLAHVRHNYRELCSWITQASASGRTAEIWPVLKADGYGHGARALATTLERADAPGLCVSLLEEGIELRGAGVRGPILVMGGYYGRYRDGIEALVNHRLTPVVYDADQLQDIATALRYLRFDKRFGVHLKIDTGMGRLGVTDDELGTVLQTFRNCAELELAGLMTHLACADAPSLADTEGQLQVFDRATDNVRRAGFAPTVRHAANSAAMLRLPTAHFEMVRPGIAVFGVHPCPDHHSRQTPRPKLKPVMRVLTEVVALRDLPVGARIGYGYQWKAARPSRIATIPMGYADGLHRGLAGRGHVLIGGRRAPIVGAVSMDLTMVDVTDFEGVAVRDEVVVLGDQRGRFGQDTITADEIATYSGSISWEVLTSISRRVPRFYREP